MQPLNYEEVLRRITTQDARFRREAYFFLREGLDYTQRKVTESNQDEPRHVTGKELLAGLRDYALSQYGPMAKAVLNEWGVHRCEDFGEIVFNMVEQGLLSKTDQDRREDFAGGYDFDEAFCKPFRPRPSEAAPTPPKTKADSL